jgi:hypothetical protein
LSKKVLIACEFSQAVCSAMRDVGVDAWSNDVLPCEGDLPDYHLHGDCFEVLSSYAWDAVIAFPPCTHLAGSGARYWAEKRADGRQRESIEFATKFSKLGIPYCIENPVGILSTVWRKPDQIVQPHWFGHAWTKTTCLWLDGLPLLVPTDSVEPTGYNKTLSFSPSADRPKLRSITPSGVALAMAAQWKEALT